MNIFYLDENIVLCAQYHCDVHVVKMILESAQMLCTALYIHGQNAQYKPAHINHPCTIWCTESLDNWLWLKTLGLALNDEYKYRYNKNINHKSADVIINLPMPEIKAIGLTKRPQAMPDQYKKIDPIEAYRAYYIGEKQKLFKWTKRNVPYWITDKLNK